MKKSIRNFLVLLFGLSGFTASAQIVFIVESPASLAGNYDFSYADWGANMDTITLTAEAAFAYDSSPTQDSLGCLDIVNTSEISGKIAVLYRGDCTFVTKAKNAQDSGAVAVIIINNAPGDPIAMGGNASDGVVIPVVMISSENGALLRDSILAGAVTIYIGNNTGLFDYNVGIYPGTVGIAQSFSSPAAFLGSEGDTIRLGAWAFNYGAEEATGTKVTAQILRDGTEVFSETSEPAGIPALGDSAYFSFAEFLASAPGYYTIRYTIEADSVDAYPSDNKVEVNFSINTDGRYSKTRIDPTDGPQLTGSLQPGLQPGEMFEEWEFCTAMRSYGNTDLQVKSVTFAASVNEPNELDGKSVFVKFYEWNDAGATFNDMIELTSNEIYDFSGTANSEFVTHEFAEPIDIVYNQKYLTCLFVDDADIFIGYDTKLDYYFNYHNTFPDRIISPLFSYTATGGTAYRWGFGLGSIPAIITNVISPNGIAENVEALNITPYPNPTTDMINIPLGTEVNGKVALTVYDMEGRLVLNKDINQNTSNLRVNVSSLTNGLHIFNLMFEDNSTTSFRVMVTK